MSLLKLVAEFNPPVYASYKFNLSSKWWEIKSADEYEDYYSKNKK